MAELDQDTLQALLDGGHISEETFSLGAKPEIDEGEKIAQDAISTPNKEYEGLKSSYEKAGAGGLAGSPETRASQDLAELNDLATRKPESLNQLESARLRELQGKASPQAEAPIVQTQAAPARVPGAIAPAVATAGQTAQPGVKLAADAQRQPNQGDAYTYALKDAPEGMKRAFDMQQIGIAAATTAGASQAAAEAAYLKKRTDEMEKMERDRQTKESMRQKVADESLSQLNKARDDLKSSADIDPNRMWHNMSTGQKVGSALGMILGSFGAISNGKNPAVDVLTQAIDRDIDAQKANYGKRKDVYNAQQGIYAEMRNKFQDERQADAAAKVAALDIAGVQLQKLAAQYKSPMVQAQAFQALGQLEAEKQKAMLEFGQKIMRSGAMMNATETARRLELIPESLKSRAYEELEKLDKHESALKNVRSAFDTIVENNTLAGTVSPQARALTNAARTTMKSYTSELFGGKSESEFELMDHLMSRKMATKEEKDKIWDMIEGRFNSQLSTPTLSQWKVRAAPIKLDPPVRK
jgi:hypothetical protein